MPTPRERSLADRLAVACAGATDVPAFADAVFRAVDRVVPFRFACLATLDPATGLISAAYKSAPLDSRDEEWAQVEYGYPDVDQFADIALRPDPVAVLSISTNGDPLQCRRFREFLSPRFGFTDELRVVLRLQGLSWGAISLSRGPGEPAFTADDARTVLAVHAQLAESLRSLVFASAPASTTPVPGPAVIIIDPGLGRPNTTPAALERISDLGGWEHDRLPAVVLATAAMARSTPELAVSRVLGRSGQWYLLRATTFAGSESVVVTVDLASAADISAMALAARGLSSREQDVAGLVLQGAATTAISAALHLSPHTVQDHLKSIFGKLGVNSRREMIQQLVLS